MEETIVKEVFILLRNNHDLLILVIIIFGVVSLIAFAAMGFFFIKLRAGLNLIERYHRIFKISDVEDYVALVSKKAALKAEEDYNAKFANIIQELKEKDISSIKVRQNLSAFLDEMRMTILCLIPSIPPQTRKQAIEFAWRDAKNPVVQNFLAVIRGHDYLLQFVPVITEEPTGNGLRFIDKSPPQETN